MMVSERRQPSFISIQARCASMALRKTSGRAAYSCTKMLTANSLETRRCPVLGARHRLVLVLWVFASHVNEDQKYGTYVGYAELARITGYSPRTIKRAVEALEEQGLIKRTVRPHHSNFTHVNVKRIHDAALANRTQWKAEREMESPFELPTPVSRQMSRRVSDVELPLRKSANSTDVASMDVEGVNRLLSMLSDNFGNHATYSHEHADRIMRGCVIKVRRHSWQREAGTIALAAGINTLDHQYNLAAAARCDDVWLGQGLPTQGQLGTPRRSL